jgi:hypothetical protein
MKKILYLLVTSLFCTTAFAQVTDPCTGAGATEPISPFSPCNCSEAKAGTSCNKSTFSTQVAADNAIHTFLTTQSNYALPTTPIPWQDVRSSNMYLDGSAGGGGIIKHEFSTEITTGPSTTVINVININQVQINCNAVCQDYKIIEKVSGTCGTNAFTPVLIPSTITADAVRVKYRQYTVSPNTTYIISRQIYFDGNDIDCFLPWIGGDGVSSTGAKITAQHWFIWSLGTLSINNLHFTAKQLNSSVMLQWSTSQEINTAKFEVERSPDAINFVKIGEASAAGNSISEKNYWIEDKNPMGVNFYRLKSIDKDDKITYSPVSKLIFNADNKTALIIAPNPVKENESVLVESKLAATTTYKIINTNGQIVQSAKIILQKGINKIAVNVSSLSAGTYLFVTEIKNERVTGKFVKE